VVGRALAPRGQSAHDVRALLHLLLLLLLPPPRRQTCERKKNPWLPRLTLNNVGIMDATQTPSTADAPRGKASNPPQFEFESVRARRLHYRKLARHARASSSESEERALRDQKKRRNRRRNAARKRAAVKQAEDAEKRAAHDARSDAARAAALAAMYSDFDKKLPHACVAAEQAARENCNCVPGCELCKWFVPRPKVDDVDGVFWLAEAARMLAQALVTGPSIQRRSLLLRGGKTLHNFVACAGEPVAVKGKTHDVCVPDDVFGERQKVYDVVTLGFVPAGVAGRIELWTHDGQPLTRTILTFHPVVQEDDGMFFVHFLPEPPESVSGRFFNTVEFNKHLCPRTVGFLVNARSTRATTATFTPDPACIISGPV
jgi:hypothetical protein